MKLLLHMIRKEILQLRHDRKMIPMLIGAPIVQLIVLGLAANLDVRDIPLLVVDSDHTQASRELADRFTGSGYFRLVGVTEDPSVIDDWLVRGRAQVALVTPEGFAKEIDSGGKAKVQVIADGTEANSAVVGLGYASIIMAGRSRELMTERLRQAIGLALGGAPSAGHARAGIGSAGDARAAGGVQSPAAPRAAGAFLQPGRIALAPRVWYNPDLRSRWFYVPAILAMVLMLTTMILPSMAVVREKEIGTLEQLIVTPIRPWQILAGKLLPFALIGLINLAMVAALAVWLFGVPLRGSFLLLALLSALFLMTTLGLGLFTSTLVRNQQQAMMTSIFLLMVPMIYLSGLIFPIENMPRVIQYGTYGIPLRYYNNIIRGIFLRGSGLSTLWPDAVILTVYGLLILIVASLRFRKRLD